MAGTKAFTSAAALVLLASFDASASDWPQWRGPNRDGISQETGLLREWPKEGPPLLWTASGLGAGYASPAIARGRVYVTGRDGGQEKLSALDLSGKLLWEKTYGAAWGQSFPDARTTPTVVDGAAYVISGGGTIVCFDAATGAVRWSVDGMRLFEGRPGPWGTAESPLVVDDKLIYTPAGARTTVVALDRRTGRTAWTSRSLDDQGAYVSPIAISVGGRRQVVAVTGNFILGVDAATGGLDWQVRYADIEPLEPGQGGDINTNTPLHRNGRIYVTSGYNHAGVMLQLARNGRAAKVVWVDKTLDNHHGHTVLVAGRLYGSNWIDNNRGKWVSLDWLTGKVNYEADWHTKGSIVAADGRLYCYEERQGHLALVEPTPAGFEVRSQFRIAAGDGPHWGHPAISDGRLYVRRGDVLMAYAVSAPALARAAVGGVGIEAAATARARAARK